MQSVLDSVRVVELTEALAGPYCAMLLGDFGADVVKVERPGTGDHARSWGPPFIAGESAHFLAANRNKRSITLDYDQPADLAVLERLIATADVFLINQPSLESLRKRGLDPDAVLSRHPRLIYCAISGYGLRGSPKAGFPGYDIIAQAEAGVMSFTGEPEGDPVRYPVAIADMTCGLYGATGILAALLARERSGRGQFLDMALFDSQLTWLINIGSNWLNASQEPKRWGNAYPSIVPYEIFAGSDGRHFVLGIGTDAIWKRLTEVLDAGDSLGSETRFETNAGRIEHRADLLPPLTAMFRATASVGVAGEAVRSENSSCRNPDRSRSAFRSAGRCPSADRRNRAPATRYRPQHCQPGTPTRHPALLSIATAAAGRA